MTDNLTEDEVIIIDSHYDIFKGYQIHFWRKDKISNILPAIKCPSFKSETKFFKFSEIEEMVNFIYYQNHTKSIVIENADEKLSINLIYGDTIKITPMTLWSDYQYNDFFDKLQERYKLWEIDDCACKPKKIRVWEWYFKILKYAIDQLKWISNINDVKLGMKLDLNDYLRFFNSCSIIVFNHSAIWISGETSDFMFSWSHWRLHQKETLTISD